MKKEKKELINDPTFSKKNIVNIKKAVSLIEMAVYKSCYNNRDTQMLMEAVEEIEKVIKWQYQ